MGDIVERLRLWPTKVERLEAEPEPAFRLMLDAAAEIERMQRLVHSWQRCAIATVEMYGGCVRPEYWQRMEDASMSLAGLVRLTDEEREAIVWSVSAAEDCQHPAGDTLRGLLERTNAKQVRGMDR